MESAFAISAGLNGVNTIINGLNFIDNINTKNHNKNLESKLIHNNLDGQCIYFNESSFNLPEVKFNIIDKIYKIYENTEPEIPATTFFTIYGKDSNGEPKQKKTYIVNEEFKITKSIKYDYNYLYDSEINEDIVWEAYVEYKLREEYERFSDKYSSIDDKKLFKKVEEIIDEMALPKKMEINNLRRSNLYRYIKSPIEYKIKFNDTSIIVHRDMYDWWNKITYKIKFDANIYFKPLLENGKVGGYKIYQNPKFEELFTRDWSKSLLFSDTRSPPSTEIQKKKMEYETIYNKKKVEEYIKNLIENELTNMDTFSWDTNQIGTNNDDYETDMSDYEVSEWSD